jgi:hypothetical protein
MKYLIPASLVALTTYVALSHLATGKDAANPGMRVPGYTAEEMRAIYEHQKELDAQGEGGRRFQASLEVTLKGLEDNTLSLEKAVAGIEASARAHNPVFLVHSQAHFGDGLDVRQRITLTLLLHLHAAGRSKTPGAAEAFARVMAEVDRWPADRAAHARKALAGHF